MAARGKQSRELDAADRKSIPDSQYALPSKHKEPLNDASHVRNAIARFDQVRDVTDAERDEAFRRIKAAAKRFGVEVSESRWQDLGKPSATMRSSDKPRTQSKAERYRSGGGSLSRDELYAEAARRGIRGRSNMSKNELQRALSG